MLFFAGSNFIIGANGGCSAISFLISDFFTHLRFTDILTEYRDRPFIDAKNFMDDTALLPMILTNFATLYIIFINVIGVSDVNIPLHLSVPYFISSALAFMFNSSSMNSLSAEFERLKIFNKCKLELIKQIQVQYDAFLRRRLSYDEKPIFDKQMDSLGRALNLSQSSRAPKGIAKA